MKIGDEIYIRGIVDEIRKDTIIIRNSGGYFGTVPEEIVSFTATKALEKQNPMPVRDIHVDEYYCPRCGSENLCSNKKVEDKFCPNCGQALKAGEEDE